MVKRHKVEGSKDVKELMSRNVSVQETIVDGNDCKDDKDGEHFRLGNDTDAAQCRKNGILERP